MKRFANADKKFSIINIKKNRIIENVPYADQCYKNYYYGTDLSWEEHIGKMIGLVSF